MGTTPLQDQGEGFGAASVSDYRGAATAASFGDPQAEFAVLRSGCGVYDLGFRTKISLTGGDRVRWLNGMVTNNIRDLAAGHGVYAFLLNPQGRILGDLYAYNRGESITVDTDRGQAEKILATFDHYIIMDDVEVTNLAEQLTALGLAGPDSHAVLAKAGFAVPELPPLQMQTVPWQGIDCTVVRCEDPQHTSYEIWMAPDRVRQLWDALLAAGATRVGSEALELQRIVSGIPRYGVDIRERDLPQETEQARALNFNKGCYVGQEVVSRMKHRGAARKRIVRVTLSSEAIPGTPVLDGDLPVGALGLSSGREALAMLRLDRVEEAQAAGRPLSAGGAKVAVAE